MNSTRSKKLAVLRGTAIAEGITFLVLILIAMPLKYFFDLPVAVKIAGWPHGILFMVFIGLAWNYMSAYNKSIKWFGVAFVCALLPAGTFWFDARLRREEKPFI